MRHTSDVTIMRAALACAKTRSLTVAPSVPVPTIGRNDVLVAVRAAGVNRIDVGAVRDGYATDVFTAGTSSSTWIPGREFAGVVADVGRDVRGVSIGDRVYGAMSPTTSRGAFAEYAVSPAHALARTPSDVTDVDAAAIPFAALTAWRALRDKGGARAGERVLVLGGGSAVGTCAAALARDLGCEVAATARARHFDRLRDMGVRDVVDYTVKHALRETAERESWAPFDVAVDCVGTRSTEAQAIERLKLGLGRYVTLHGDLGKLIGDERGMVVGAMKAFTEYAKKKTLSRWQKDVGYEQAVMRMDPDAMVEIARLVADGALRVPVGKVLDLDDIEHAFDAARDGTAGGKVVLRIAKD